MFFTWTDPPDSQNGFAVLPYIKGVTEPLTRILNNNGIRATTRPVKTLLQEFASPKSRPPSDRQTNVVYKTPCADCTRNYIGETGRCLHTGKKEHIRNTKFFKSGSNIASHARQFTRKKNAGILAHCMQLLARQTTILSSCQDNTQFYFNLIHAFSILLSHSVSFVLLYLFIFVRYFLPFLYIYIFTSTFYTSLFKDCRLAIESWCFFKTFNQRTSF